MGDSKRSGAEPEWFTEGPLSQSDTIELHGFECLQKSKSGSKEERLLGSSGASAASARDEARTLQQQPNSSSKKTQVVVTETAAVPRESKEEEPSVFSDAGQCFVCPAHHFPSCFFALKPSEMLLLPLLDH